ncbi:tetratricopeptide repeat protein [Thermus sp.]|uniref:tetratricopeptide repeat protein n=1 Tax=Thermus sp. TaxID=275 RepID=UPI00307F584A
MKPLLQGYDPPAEALLLWGFAHYRLGQMEEALFTFSRLVGTLQGGGEAAYGLGLALRALGDLEGARAALDCALRLGYAPAGETLRGLPPPPPPSPKGRRHPLEAPFRAEKGRFWVRGEPLTVRGVNLGVALPGRFPAEFPEEEALYRAWLELLWAMGANAVRVYTLLPPAFYRALQGLNRTHRRPLYLFQGVWTELPEELGHPSYEGAFLKEFLREGRDVLDALHGNLLRPQRPGHAGGTYTADVSPWTLGLMVGREFEPFSVARYNREHPERSYRGRFLEAAPEANPFEAWMAEVLDRLLTYEAEAYGTVRPVGFSNWPTLDPLHHPTESTGEEERALRRARGERVEKGTIREYNNDEVSLDARNIRPLPASPATVFANYHAYPYYPDFMNLDPGYGQAVGPLGRSNYFGYLLDLKRHHGDQPVLIGEYGVPSSRGIAHFQPQGFHHGGHSEEGQAERNLRLWREIEAAGLAGSLLFSFLDEWFKRNWLFMEWEDPERDPLWHNLLDPEENYGLLAATAPRGPRLDGKGDEWEEVPFLLREEGVFLKAQSDPEYLWLLYRGPLPLRLHLDTVPGGVEVAPGFGAEFALEVGAEGRRLLVEAGYYPFREVRPGGAGTEALIFLGPTRPTGGPFVPFLLEPNRRRTGRDGTDYPRQVYELGLLRRGVDPEGARDPTADYALGDYLELRLPWGMLLMADPSRPRAWYAPDPLPIPSLGLWVEGLGGARFTLAGWEAPAFALRLKPAYFRFREAWAREAASEGP